MSKRNVLGRGLDALIPTDEGAIPSSGVLSIPIEQIIPNPHQPRSQIDPEELAELTASIKEHGILQPVIVSFDSTRNLYILIAGERRWQAAQQAGLKAIPAIQRQVDEQQRLELALVENLQREDLNPLEAAEAYNQLIENFHLSHEEISARVGKSRVAITNTLRLLKLPDAIKQALSEKRITEGHARALLTLPTTQSQIAALQSIIMNDLSVRQTEELVRKLTGERIKPSSKHENPPEIRDLEEQIRKSLGTKVTISTRKTGGGTITLHYYSDEELESLISKLLPEE